MERERRVRHYLKEWRDYRDLTLERAAERAGFSVSQISLVENGKRRFTEGLLAGLAFAYNCEPDDLLRAPPNSEEAQIIDLLRHLKGHKRADAIAMLRGLLQSDSGAA